jgi:hypothetical protein
LENTEGAIKNGQSRETGIIGYTRGRQIYKSFNIPLVYNLPISLFNATYNSSTVRLYKSFNIPLLYNSPISLFNATDNSSTVMFYKSYL